MSHREFDIKMRRRSSKLNGVSCLAPALHETFYCPIKWILMKAVIAFSNTRLKPFSVDVLLAFSVLRLLFSHFITTWTHTAARALHTSRLICSQTFADFQLDLAHGLVLAATLVETASWKLPPMQDSHSHNLWFQLPTHISHVWWSGRINNLWDVFM